MKPFNLEKALAGEEVITRDGQPVKVLHLLTDNFTYPLLVVIDPGTDNESIGYYYANGRYSATREHAYDLFMKSKEVYNLLYQKHITLPEEGNARVSFKHVSPEKLSKIDQEMALQGYKLTNKQRIDL